MLVHGIGSSQGGPRAADHQGAGAGGPAPGRDVPGPLPARAVRRPAAAGRDRDRARARPAAAARRRAGLDAGRLGPGRRAVAAGQPAPGRRHGHPDDHPRPVHGGALRRQDRGHVPRPDRRARHRQRGRPQPAAPLYQGAAVGRAQARPAGHVGAADPHRRDARPGRRPARLPVPSALPDRGGSVPDRRPCAPGCRSRLTWPLPPGRVHHDTTGPVPRGSRPCASCTASRDDDDYAWMRDHAAPALREYLAAERAYYDARDPAPGRR